LINYLKIEFIVKNFLIGRSNPSIKHRLAIKHWLVNLFYGFLLVFCTIHFVFGQSSPIRKIITLNEGWRTVADNTDKNAFPGFEKAAFNDKSWKLVTVPHNWDTYDGIRRMKHGNRHGYAWYRKIVKIPAPQGKQRYFLFFEGVGSYATVYLNGRQVGYHAGGRTTFTLDITETVVFNRLNVLAVRADHPAYIKDLPWVCGGCSDEIGFSEGSQPMGIFRPVSLIVTGEVKVEPFGVHIWNDTTVSGKSAILYLETSVKNYSHQSRHIIIRNHLIDREGIMVAETKSGDAVQSGSDLSIRQQLSLTGNVHLWYLQDPYLYTLVTQVVENGKVLDELKTAYGIRWISWPVGRTDGSKQFLLNGKPVFINGTAEYEHLLGQSHAFSDEEIITRVKQVRAAGFNAFRDAHQPHNLLYQRYWDESGILWWPQFTAHIWYDTPEFRNNFKELLKDWVKERRNNPSNILWGLQNESVLPAEFAKECADIIRELDPTASSQRKITTCNGGQGTDWNVPQNWTGTYGGNPFAYADEIQKQELVGEYGAWRSIDLHADGNVLQNVLPSENKMDLLLETKVRLAESVKDKVCGQFNWLLYSHENPGRAQSGEGMRETDRIGPVNYKGLFTLWGEPTDVFYMYRSNYTSALKEPMVYIVSHTWPDRWITPGIKDSITVYSNCDEVELFNDVQTLSLGRKKRKGIGTHFEWNNIPVKYNVLYAVGYVNGKAVSKDCIVLHHLPAAPHIHSLTERNADIIRPSAKLHYVYRVNCGGPEYKDHYGNTWLADCHKTGNEKWGSTSWADEYAGVPAFFASQRINSDPIRNTTAWPLFQSYRYGREKLKYEFPVPDGDYSVELYFIEPWYGIGGGLDATGWRLFDVVINDKTVIHNLDIWKEAGEGQALKKVVRVHVTGGRIVISFPSVKAGQAIIAAIAIASPDESVKTVVTSSRLLEKLQVNNPGIASNISVQSWLNTGDRLYEGSSVTIAGLPPVLYGADWIRTPQVVKANLGKEIASFTVKSDADVYIGILPGGTAVKPLWMKEYADTRSWITTDAPVNNRLAVYRKSYHQGETVVLGENDRDSMYLVTVCQAVSMDPAYDLKPAVDYKIEKAFFAGEGIKRDSVNGKKCITFIRQGTDTLGWNFSVGVADIYTLQLRYVNETMKPLQVWMKISSSDGSILKEELLTFNPYIKGKWGILHTSTGTSINAGNYKLVLYTKDADLLSLGSLEVQ
jgi:hypothetical protein